jgi:membrane-associated protease RseP (regulator of RpoE activity)
VTGGLIVVFGIIAMVMIHEGGHFLAAKATGMKVTEFFFGFGPKLWSIRRGETEYGVKALPLGGYVRIVGMNPYEEVAPEDLGRTYREQKFSAKAIVVLAGVASHFIVAFLLFYTVASILGVSVSTTTVASVQATLADGTPSPAAAAGILPGDRIAAIGGVETETWFEAVEVIAAHPGDAVVVVVVRGDQTLEIPVTLAAVDDEEGGERGFLGVRAASTKERTGPIAGIGEAGAAVGRATIASAEGLWRMVSGFGGLVEAVISGDAEGIEDRRPASPIGLVRIGAQTEDLGIAFTLELLALVNVFVGLFNIVPIYPLDGGHFAVALYEKVRGRPADVRKLAPIVAVVVAFLVLLGVLAIYLDIANPFTLR